MQPRRPRLIETILSPLQAFMRLETTSSIVLIICTAAALIWANSPWHESYHHLWHNTFGFTLNGHSFKQPLHFWVNDALMAIFFLVVGLEIKREVLGGELSTLRKAALPVLGALGGMTVPALLFLLCAGNTEFVRAWATPTATDIAFALGICRLLGSRVSFGLYVFLAALAIADDLGAIIIIALFYSTQLDWVSLGVVAALIALLLGLNRMGVRAIPVYVVFGAALWYATFRSGIHATISGVLLALCIPARQHIDMENFIATSRRKLARLDIYQHRDDLTDDDYQAQQSIVNGLEENCELVQTPLQRIQNTLNHWVAYLIMPLFALSNAGIALSGDSLKYLSHPIFQGIVLGLVIGKPVGIFLFSWLGTKLKIAALPAGISYRALAGVACLGGIGFTMSIFIANLSLSEEPLQIAKFSILTASTLASLVGWAAVMLRFRVGEKVSYFRVVSAGR